MSSYRHIREVYRLTQRELGCAFGVSHASISLWESDTYSPPLAVQAAYRMLQEPMRTGDADRVERLRAAILDLPARAMEEARRLNRAPRARSPRKLVRLRVGAVARSLLLATLFVDL